MGRVAAAAAAGPVALPSWFHPALIAVPALAVTSVLPPGDQTIAALVAIIVLGVPHGALDGEIARAILRPRFGWAWFPVFSAPYLALAALALLAWHIAPMPTLAVFLLGSAWHFGTEDAPDAILEAAVRGGLPVAVPVMVHPAATWAVFATVSGLSQPNLPDWLWTAAAIWLVLAAVWAGRIAFSQHWHRLVSPALLIAMFVALPPLSAFAIYFVCVHAPAHTAALIEDPWRAPRVRDARSAVLLALPITTLTLLIGAGLWPFYSGPTPDRLLSLTLQSLAALTLPHMLLDALTTAVMVRKARPTRRG